MRILFINRMAATERGGGETFDLEIARHLAELGHEITFLSCRPLFVRARLGTEVGSRKSEVRSQTTDNRPLTTDLRLISIRSPMFPWFPWDRVKAGWRVRVAEFWLFEKLAARWASKHRDRFDIIQVCELPTFVSSFKSKIENRESKIVMRLTAPNAYDPSGGIQKADALIASGTSIAKIRASVRADCFNVPNGVDLKRFRSSEKSVVRSEKSEVRSQNSDLPPSPRLRRTSRPPTSFCGPPTTAPRILLYVARFQAFKNHTMLIRAFTEVLKTQPDVQLWLAGSGPLESDIKNLARDLKVHNQVRFLGEVPFDDLPGIYTQADLKVISSEYESFCFAAIEAMASGLPVVTTDCGWVPGLIGDGLSPIEKQWVEGDDPPERFDGAESGSRIREVPGGLVVSRTEPLSFARAMVELLKHAETRQRKGQWNRTKAERDHGWESSAKKLEAVYLGLQAT